MEKIVLIHPPMTLKDLYGGLSGAGSELAPQGLCLLAAILRENNYDPVIIDSTTMRLDADGTVDEVFRYDTKYIGITVYTTFLKVVYEIASKIKSRAKDLGKEISILVGGSHITYTKGESFKECSDFDFGVIGEGEITLVDLLNHLESDRDLSKVQGIVYRKNGQVIKTSPRSFISDLDILPLPAWDLLPRLDKYYVPAGDSIKRFPSAGLVTSRGCDGKCYFCNPRQFGKETRGHSADYIIRMIKDLQTRYDIKDIYFQDDTFVVNKNTLLEFCRKTVEQKMDLTWACMARVTHVDLEMLKIMKESGCWQIGFGIESGSQKVLDNINKGTTVERNKLVLKWCKEVGIDVKGLFMIGCFGETRETICDTINFIKNSYMTDFHMTFFTPTPATVSYSLWEKYGTFNPDEVIPVTSAPNFIPDGLTAEELVKCQKKCYRTFYLNPRIVWRYFLKLLKPKQANKIIKSGIAFSKYTLFQRNW